MNDRTMQIRCDDYFMGIVQHLKEINGYKTNSETIRHIIEKEERKERMRADEREPAEWLPYEFGDYHWRKCSACGTADMYIDTVTRNVCGVVRTVDHQSLRYYCPICGARMKNP